MCTDERCRHPWTCQCEEQCAPRGEEIPGYTVAEGRPRLRELIGAWELALILASVVIVLGLMVLASEYGYGLL